MKSNLQKRYELNIPELKSMIPYSIVAKIEWCKNNQSCLLGKLLLIFAMTVVSSAYAQNYTEVEPNNPCSSAQDLGTLDFLPTQVDGYKAQSDVDFYKFSATPGTQIQVTMSGDSTNPGTIVSYVVGFFSSACDYAIKYAYGSPAVFDFTVPPDGVFIIGATALADFSFTGSGTLEGGYALSIVPQPLTVITGIVIDADTGAGLPGNQPPFASVTLEQCYDYVYYGYCYYRESTQTDSQGYFRFQGDFNGNFRVRVNADQFLYEQPIFSPTGPLGYESIPITSGVNYDFGDIPIAPIIPIESISGQVKDSVTGRPLSGTVEPFARVQLYRSNEFLGEIPTNERGNYVFSSAVVGHPLPRGDYRIVGFASQYQQISNTVDLVNIQAHEVRVAPVLKLLSNPVRITDVKACKDIPAQGASCDFSYKVTNGTSNRMKGVAWSMVTASGTGGFVNGTDFLACQQSLNLACGKGDVSQVMRCRFTVPASVPAYANICADARFGEGSGGSPYFTVQGVNESLFCLTKLPEQGGFKVLPQRAAVELIRQHKGGHR